MNPPHVLMTRHQYTLGNDYTFQLQGLNIADAGPLKKLTVLLTETIQPVTWTVISLSPPVDNTVTVTARPSKIGHKVFTDGGDGSLTITVNNGESIDPAPPVVPSSYS